jgi:membrane-associated HD superfamily phosphohydrolase
MSSADFINKIRQLDNLAARWMMRHFYFLFFQIVIVVVFFFWFVDVLNVIDIGADHPPATGTDRLLMSQTVNLTIIVFLMLLNSFWMLYIFNTIQRIMGNLRDMSFQISKLRPRGNQHPSHQ